MLALILMILAAIFLGCAAFNFNPPKPWINFGWLGMFFWALSILSGAAGPLLR